MSEQCCCNWGCAVSGETPEFECWDCPKHGGGIGLPDERCKRHDREHMDALLRALKGADPFPRVGVSTDIIEDILRLVYSWDKTYHFRAPALVLRNLLREHGVEVDDPHL